MSVGTYSDFLSALGQNESGNNYAFTSSLGYLGRFQFGEEALQTIGFYAGDGNPGAIDFSGGWTSFANSFGVYDKASFLATAAAQDAAGQAWFAKIYQDVQGLGLDKYIGQTVGGVAVSPSGLVAGAHLVGVWALKSYLETGGAVNTPDGYGTLVSQYVQKFGGFDTPFGAATGQAGTSPVAAVQAWAVQVATNGIGYGVGGANDDTITGAGVTNILRGNEGADLITGGSGFDDINGNIGNDTLHGGGGDDWVVGGKDNDVQFGEAGNDIVWGNLGEDTLDGGDGADQVRGGQGNDLLTGGAGDDFVSGDRGDDTISGGAGADLFHGSQGIGLDRITDFHIWEGDKVVLDPGTSYSLSQAGADTIVDLGGGDRMVLENVQLSSLPAGWIL